MNKSSETTASDIRLGKFGYMDSASEPSLYRNGKVYTKRDTDGSDAKLIGVDLSRIEKPVHNARNLPKSQRRTLIRNGFEVLTRPLSDTTIDFLDNDWVVREYYSRCAEIVKEVTGARIVEAFDHNVRSAAGKQSKRRIEGGQQVQGPAHVVHGDYTLTSAPQRLRDLANPPKTNDTLRAVLGEGDSLLESMAVERAIESGRFAIINLWRNIASEPVATNPMALCDAATVRPEDLVVFEIHYADRIGENYFAKHADGHDWYCYPAMTPDEVLLITQWDSAGAMAQSRGENADSSAPDAPCTFSFHSAFEDPRTPEGAPDRWSIEVRCAVLYE